MYIVWFGHPSGDVGERGGVVDVGGGVVDARGCIVLCFYYCECKMLG
jgi:hypothetical protein